MRPFGGQVPCPLHAESNAAANPTTDKPAYLEGVLARDGLQVARRCSQPGNSSAHVIRFVAIFMVRPCRWTAFDQSAQAKAAPTCSNPVLLLLPDSGAT